MLLRHIFSACLPNQIVPYLIQAFFVLPHVRRAVLRRVCVVVVPEDTLDKYFFFLFSYMFSDNEHEEHIHCGISNETIGLIWWHLSIILFISSRYGAFPSNPRLRLRLCLCLSLSPLPFLSVPPLRQCMHLGRQKRRMLISDSWAFSSSLAPFRHRLPSSSWVPSDMQARDGPGEGFTKYEPSLLNFINKSVTIKTFFISQRISDTGGNN